MTAPKQTVVATLRGGVELEFGVPSLKDWQRYLQKLLTSTGSELPAKRELLQVTCVSHDVDALQAAIKKAPAALRTIAEEIDSIAGGDISPVFNEASETVSAKLPDGTTVEFGLPDLDQYEALQEALSGKNSRAGETIFEFLKELDKHGGAGEAIARYPAVLAPLSSAINDAAGGDVEVTVKKG